jgi:4-amino-4-deoxy-L-arabinose transferase-like glycosyltransferase
MALLALLGLLVLVPTLGSRDLWYPDEPDVGQVAQAMYESGDWIAPRRNDLIWVDYPPMIYWAGSIASHALGGMSEFTLRLPTALAAIALVLLTCAAASRWFGPRVGLWSGLVLLSFHHFAYEAQGFRPDMLFSLWIGAGLFSYAAGCGERPGWGLRALGFACFGLAMLAKGPLGLLLPGLVLTRRW